MVSSSSDSKPLSSPECLTQPPLLSIHFPAPLAISTDLPTFLTVTVLDLVLSLPLRCLNNLESLSFLLETYDLPVLTRRRRLQSTITLYRPQLSAYQRWRWDAVLPGKKSLQARIGIAMKGGRTAFGRRQIIELD